MSLASILLETSTAISKSIPLGVFILLEVPHCGLAVIESKRTAKPNNPNLSRFLFLNDRERADVEV